MSDRITNFLLTLLGTLLVLLTLGCVLLIPIYVGFGSFGVRAGEAHVGRLLLGSLGFLAAGTVCAGGAWAIRRVLKRRESPAPRR